MATLKGESGTSYEFNYGTNAMCRAEKLTGQSYNQILATMAKEPPATFLRQFIQATLVNPSGLDPDGVGDVIDDIGGLDVVMAQFHISLMKPEMVGG